MCDQHAVSRCWRRYVMWTAQLTQRIQAHAGWSKIHLHPAHANAGSQASVEQTHIAFVLFQPIYNPLSNQRTGKMRLQAVMRKVNRQACTHLRDSLRGDTGSQIAGNTLTQSLQSEKLWLRNIQEKIFTKVQQLKMKSDGKEWVHAILWDDRI